jgi:hypothetical protein
MLGEMMRTEFERRRVELAFLTLIFAALPGVYALKLAGADAASVGARLGSASTVVSLLGWPLTIVAVRWGMGAWATERRGRWVYTLSLPVGRLRLFALRYLAALAWLAVPALALTAVSYAGAAALRLPPGLYAYPGHFVAWNAICAWFLFTAGFVAGYASAHPWRWIVVPVVATILFLIVADSRWGAPLAPVTTWMAEGKTSLLLFFVESPDLVGY